MAEESNKNQISIELSEEMAEGEYANLATIAHSNSEFVIDFIRLMPGTPKAKVKARIIVTPEHAKRLLYALKDNIDKFEDAFGDIKQTDESPKFPINFGGAMGEAWALGINLIRIFLYTAVMEAIIKRKLSIEEVLLYFK